MPVVSPASAQLSHLAGARQTLRTETEPDNIDLKNKLFTAAACRRSQLSQAHKPLLGYLHANCEAVIYRDTGLIFFFFFHFFLETAASAVNAHGNKGKETMWNTLKEEKGDK